MIPGNSLLNNNIRKRVKSFFSQRVRVDLDNYVGISLIILFIVQLLTGLGLSLYYQPSPTEAHESLKFIMNELPFGWLIRSIHYWAAHMFLFIVLAQLIAKMLRRKFSMTYSNPWIVGLILSIFAAAWFITGELLSWSNNIFWEVDLLTGELNGIPFIGKYIRLFIRGGEAVGYSTLTRFYVFHILFFLLICVPLGIYHVYSALKHRLVTFSETREGRVLSAYVLSIDTLIIMFLIFSVLMGVSVFLPREIPELADPAKVPDVISISWYIYPFYKFYTLIPAKILFLNRVTVFSICILVVAGLYFSLPYIYSSTRNAWKKVAYACVVGFTGLYVITVIWRLLR